MKRGILISIGFFAVLVIILGLNVPSETESPDETEGPDETEDIVIERGLDAGEKVVILELFTSQGCSSCPPAESVLSKIARDKKYATSVIPLAYHVDYWDYLGWKDPYASGKWTERQADYREAFGGATLYTPQIVIQGRYEMVGSNESRIKKQINHLLGDQSSEGFNLAIKDASVASSSVALDVQASRKDVGEDELLVLVSVIYENAAATNVQAGENAGRTLRNNYVVRSLEMEPLLFDDTQTSKQIQVSLLLDETWQREQLGVASWIQDPQSMRIYDAAAVSTLVP